MRENSELRNMARQFSAGYDELFKKPGPKGKILGYYLSPDKIGIFVINQKGKDTIYACGQVLKGSILESKHKD